MPFIRRAPFRRSLPRSTRRAAAAALCLAALGAPPHAEAQRWFSTDIVSPRVSQGALPSSGYARFYVSSHLDPLRGRAYGADREFAMLVVNVAISPGGGAQPVEYPVALYDLRERRRVDVAALQLGEVRYLDLRAGSQPVVTVKVQAVPRNVADPFRRAINSFNQQVQSTPVASLVLDGPLQVGGLSRLLGSILPPEVEQRWTSAQVIGLTSRPDMAVLPLNGRPAVIFFRPSGGNVRVPTEWSQIEPCAGNAGRVCWADTHQPLQDVPYIVLSVTMEDYRPLRDFGVPDFVCAPTGIADHVARMERVVREAPLSQQQRDLEMRLLEHLRLVADAASGRMGTSEGAAGAAFRWARRYTGQGDPYWTAHGQEPAARYADCFTQLLTNAGSGAVNRWGYFSTAFATASVWDRQPPAAGEARTAQLEEFLSTLLRPITVYELGAGEEYAMLREEQRRIEAELLAADRAVAAELAGAHSVRVVPRVPDGVAAAGGRAHRVHPAHGDGGAGGGGGPAARGAGRGRGRRGAGGRDRRGDGGDGCRRAAGAPRPGHGRRRAPGPARPRGGGPAPARGPAPRGHGRRARPAAGAAGRVHRSARGGSGRVPGPSIDPAHGDDAGHVRRAIPCGVARWD